MKKLFMFSKDNLDALLQILPESHELTYCFFSEITALNHVIKHGKPHALLVESANYKDLIENGINIIDNSTPIIIFGKSPDFPNPINLQSHNLDETESKLDVIKLFSKLGLINKPNLTENDLKKHNKSKATNGNGLENQPFLDFLMDNI